MQVWERGCSNVDALYQMGSNETRFEVNMPQSFSIGGTRSSALLHGRVSQIPKERRDYRTNGKRFIEIIYEEKP